MFYFPILREASAECTNRVPLQAKFSDNILMYFDVLPWLTPCRLILVWAVLITPICWFGSPHDFWFAAPAALLATFVACLLIMVRESLDVRDPASCYPHLNQTDFQPTFPKKIEFLGFGEGEL